MFEVSYTAFIHRYIAVFWIMKTCRLIWKHQHFGKIYFLKLYVKFQTVFFSKTLTTSCKFPLQVPLVNTL